MIAMALACRPKLLIADEPTTALDVTIQAQILALLDDLQREFGMAMLFITHDLNLVRRFTHRVGVMERGRLVESGPTEKVFAHPQHPYTVKLHQQPRRSARCEPVQPMRRSSLAARDVSVDFVRSEGWFGKDVLHRGAVTRRWSCTRGETLGIVGESGSGKTTLGMALLALQPIAAGERAARRARASTTPTARRCAAMRRRMQVVFQDPFASLSPRMTVEQIVGEGAGAAHARTASGRAARAHPRRCWPKWACRRPHGIADVLDALSARVLRRPAPAHRDRARGGARPGVLVLDEPTSALDVSVQQQVLTLLAGCSSATA